VLNTAGTVSLRGTTSQPSPSPLTAIATTLNAACVCSDYFPRINSNIFTVIGEKDSYQQMNFVLFVCAKESVNSVFLKPPVCPGIR